MKNLKLWISALCAMLLTLALCVSAMGATGGTITVTNAEAGQTYTLYKFLDAEQDTAGTTITYYTKNSTFAGALAAETSLFVVTGPDANGKYFVTKASSASDDDVTAWFAGKKSTYGTAVTPTVTPAAGTNTAQWTGLDMGYYLLDKSGTNVTVSIDTNAGNIDIVDKNETKPSPGTDTDSDLKDTTATSASVGDTVPYTITFTATNFATETTTSGTTTEQITKYVVKDTIANATLEILKSSIKVQVGTTDVTSTVTGMPTANTTTGFEITIPWVDNSSPAKSLYTSPVQVTVTYNAVVKGAAATEGEAKNSANVTYNSTPLLTSDDDADVPVYGCTLNKTDGTNALSGAKFKVYDAETSGNEIKVVKVSDGVYRKAESGETGVAIEAGSITLKGFAADTVLYFEEVQAPTGYALLGERKSLTIVSGDTPASLTVVNTKTGKLPATGGRGTVMLIGIGAAVFCCTAIVLVTKKRLYNQG